MGATSTLQTFEIVERDGSKVIASTSDIGGGDIVDADVYLPAGDDSQPLVGDSVALVEVVETGVFAAVGFVDPKMVSKSGPGDVRRISRSAPGTEKAQIHLKSSGEVVLANGLASITISPTGAIDIVAPLGVTINGVTIDVLGNLATPLAGDVSTGIGVSLNTHIHNQTIPPGPPAVPTTPPVVVPIP